MNKLSKIIRNVFGIKKGKINLLKSFDLGCESLTQPICEDIDNDSETETIITNTKGEVIVFSENQEIKWKYAIKEKVSEQDAMFLDEERTNSINHYPLIADIEQNGKKQILFGTEFGKVYALDHNGKQIWAYTTEHPIRGGINNFKIKESKNTGIIFGSTDKYLYLLSSKGKLLRKLLNDAQIESTPIVINNNIIFGDNKGKIKSLDLKGKINWTFQTKDKIVSKAIHTKMNDGTEAILIGGVDNNLYCLSLEGKLIWKFETQGALYTEPVVLDINDDGLNEIVFGSADGKIYVITMQGNQLWNYETDFWIIGKPVTKDVDQDGAMEVIIGSYDNNIYVLTGKGIYIIEYVPGVSGIIAQNGSYSDIPSNTPGELIGDKIWEYGTGGLVIGCAVIKNKIIVQTKEGKVLWLHHEEGK
ncbi:PQQ-binding-like beta-propeller repeat protein [Candidatus Woesearchaeota archaeon]|nr:PQQ-binding-like beta-propeller repeat protein [Candidatus Woesearchaeota archaeon]